jgi:hypothetical protein
MKNGFLSLLLLLSITSACNKNGATSSPEAWINNVGVLDETYSNVNASLPNEAQTFETNIHMVNADANQTAKILKAIEIIKNVVATTEFRDRVLNYTYQGKKTFVDNRGFTNAQIYKIILDAAESLQPTVNNTMDIEVELYFDDTITVGYTYPNSGRIWVNTKFFNTYSAAGVAHNLFHEWMHKLGFDHDVAYSVDRDSSVPYAIGSIMGDLGKEFL